MANELQPRPTESPVEKVLTIPDGLSAVLMPGGNRGGKDLPTPEIAVRNLNAFLENLNRQGADIVQIINQDVRIRLIDNSIVKETALIAIVRKSSQSS
jgi:hypothetical protein